MKGGVQPLCRGSGRPARRHLVLYHDGPFSQALSVPSPVGSFSLLVCDPAIPESNWEEQGGDESAATQTRNEGDLAARRPGADRAVGLERGSGMA